MFGGRRSWHGERMDYDGGEDARSSLLEHLDGHLEGELNRTGKEHVFCVLVTGCKT